MIKQGQRYAVLKDNPKHPLSSPNTQLVAALLASGGKLSQGGYADTIGESHDGSPRRTVVWLMEETEINFFLTDGRVEKVMTSEFIKRWNDRAWIEANADHPISFMKAYQIQLSNLRDHIKNSTPLVEVKRGGMTAYINPNDPKEKTNGLLRAGGFNV